jgi:BMFP domain-containing protein YqiC
MLARLGQRAAAMYAELENSELRTRLEELEAKKKDSAHGDL